MHKYLCALLLATCTTTVMAADDDKIPSSSRILKRTKNFFPGNLESFPIIVEARQETKVMEKMKQLVILNRDSSILESSAKAYAGANNDTASLLTSEQIRTLTTAESETRGADKLQMSQMIDVLDLDGKVVYDSARYLGYGSYAQFVLNALVEFGNIVACRKSYQPQLVEGTEAKPTITVKYDIYEVPSFFTKLLEKSVMTKYMHQMFVDMLELKPLTFARAQEILNSKNRHLLEIFKGVERDFARKLEAPLSFDIRYHTSSENVTQNEAVLVDYFKTNVQESLSALDVKPGKVKKTKSSKPRTTLDQVNSSDPTSSSS